MPWTTMPALPESFQRRFARRWRHLQDKHVRSLAWLLDAPDMLDAQSPAWGGRIASLGTGAADAAAGWLAELDADPAALHSYLALGPYARLGRYAEKLLAFYFLHCGTLAAQGLQVRDGDGTTVGEFDFLLREGSALVHWEFAVKFYLLEDSGTGQATDYFVGPNLADTLGAKMDKIFSRQLALSQHPAAQAVLPHPVARAQALVKGWLFYHHTESAAPRPGLAADHCRGFWCTLAELQDRPQARLLPLNRLDWLAPARAAEGLSHAELRAKLAAQFTQDSMPVLVARLEDQGVGWEEAGRGFIVPDDWQERAGARSRPPLS